MTATRSPGTGSSGRVAACLDRGLRASSPAGWRSPRRRTGSRCRLHVLQRRRGRGCDGRCRRRPAAAPRPAGPGRGSASVPGAAPARPRSRRTHRRSPGTGSRCGRWRGRRHCPCRTGCGPASAGRSAASSRAGGQAPRCAPRCPRGSSGAARACRSRSPRSSAAHPTWAPTKVVAGCRPTSRSSAPRSSSKPGYPAPPGSIARRPEVPVGVGMELLPALVGAIERIEERDAGRRHG